MNNTEIKQPEEKKFKFLTEETKEDDLVINPILLHLADPTLEFDTNIRFSVNFVQILEGCLYYAIAQKDLMKPEVLQMFGTLQVLINALTEQAAIAGIINPMTKTEMESKYKEFQKEQTVALEKLSKEIEEKEKAEQAMTYEQRLENKLNQN